MNHLAPVAPPDDRSDLKKLFTMGDVGRANDRTVTCVKYWVKTGRIRPAFVTPGGMLLFTSVKPRT